MKMLLMTKKSRPGKQHILFVWVIDIYLHIVERLYKTVDWVVKQKQLIHVSIELCVHTLMYQECEEAHLLFTKRHDEILITCLLLF